MAVFDSLINEVAAKFGLGSKADLLVSALLALMSNDRTGGLSGFINRFRQAGMEDLVASWLGQGANAPLTPGQVESALGAETIGRLADQAKLTPEAAAPALAFIVPKVIDHLTPDGVIPAVMPAGLAPFFPSAPHASGPAPSAGVPSLVKWLVPIAALGLAVVFGYQACGRSDAPAENVRVATNANTPPSATNTSTAVNANAVANSNAAAAVPGDLGAIVEKKLPNGIVLKIPTNGVENKLLAFVEDANRQVDKETWFSFDRLEFETGSAKLKPSSEEQLRNIAEILKAFPQVNVKIGGYTDNTGNDAANLKLSGDRATATMNEIVKLGIDKARLEAEGYGKDHPVADNATEEGRQRNRRIDVRVTKK